MRIGVDAWRIHGHTGVPRYLVRVVDSWCTGTWDTRFDGATVYTPRPIDRDRVHIGGPVVERVVPSGLRQIFWQNLVLAMHCDTDVLWCPAYVTPLRVDMPVVVTTHDATNRVHPHLYGWKDRVFYGRFYGWCSRRASLVITHNAHTRDDVCRHYGVPEEKVRIVPVAPSEIFRRLEDRDDVLRRAAALLGDDRPFFLSVGKISVRRNLPIVMEGFATFRERSKTRHRLVVVGKNGLPRAVRDVASELGISDDLTHLPYVTDEELVTLYNGAAAFVTAATYEANSFTTLEAQATGTPVIIPDVKGMREMTDGIAVVLRRVSSDAVAEAMQRIASEPELVRRLSDEGLAYATSFSWRDTAQGVLDVLEEALTRGPAS